MSLILCIISSMTGSIFDCGSADISTNLSLIGIVIIVTFFLFETMYSKLPKVSSRSFFINNSNAYDILREANQKEETAGKGPMGLAAASLYMACIKYDLKISQRQISIASGVTEVTIRNRSVSMHKSRSLA